jgi:CPA2 family monovalent cation:H+ antiporter-2
MTPIVAAGSSETALAFIELGAVVLALSALARLAGTIGITAVPLYLLAGLATGEGGLVTLDVSQEFISLAGEIGVLLLLLALGLEYSEAELRAGLRGGAAPGALDAALNAVPGVALGLLLGWEPLAAVLLGGVTWVSSSGIVAKVLDDLGRLGFRETPSVLNLLVIEDLAMALYLPVVAALVAGGTVTATVGNVAVSIVVVAAILVVALRYGNRLSAVLVRGNDEALLLGVFGLTLLVAGLAQRVEVSGAIGAFLVGIAVSGPVQARASSLVAPLRDLFAATFFLFFSFQLDPADLLDALAPAAVLAVVTTATKVYTGWYAAGRAGAARKGRLRAGTVLAARGEFSIVIAALGADLVDGPDLGALAAAYVLLTAIIGPLLTKYADRIAVVSVRSRVPAG